MRFGGKLGLEVVTGDDWALIAGSRSRLSALARPWMVPPALASLAEALGRAMPTPRAAEWRVRGRVISLAQPVVIGILNATPDSFSDGGVAETPAQAVARADALLQDGAEILDIGGESTRPNRTVVLEPAQERERIVPVVRAVYAAFPDTPLSIDTMNASVARAACEAGVAIINDVTAWRHDGGMALVAAEYGVGAVLMHSRGEALQIASTEHADYADLLADVTQELNEARSVALDAGLSDDQIVVDPGFGFSKTAAQNIFLANQLDAFNVAGRPVLVGPSRKRFLGAATGREVHERDVATAALAALCYERGARLFRVHDPATTRDALAVAHALATTEL